MSLSTPEVGEAISSTRLAALHEWDNRAAPYEVNRARKSDRLPVKALRKPTFDVASIEIVGDQNVAVIYRNSLGEIVFRTEPASSTTLVAKGVVLPRLTIRDTTRPPRKIPTTPVREPPLPAMPEGCESVVSQMADRVLARVPGRCIADGEGPIRYAAASVISSN